MAEYIWAESPGTQLSESPRINSTRFGDGYEERSPDGLNPITQEWQIQHRNIDTAAGDEIMAFLRARVTPVSGLEAFDWWPLWAPGVIKVTCRQYSRTLGETLDTCTINAVFRQEHVA